jgi:hypothetical protein|tara:strand:- start:1341 stop:2237 length:897 start_codon:yes stop_codon:yes gene_type:complete
MPLDIGYKSTFKPEDVREEFFLPSKIETIDSAFTEFVDEDLNIFCTTNEGWKKVPVIWTSAERAFQIKNKKELRDSNGSLVFPVITIEKTNFVKDLTRKGAIFAAVPAVNDIKGGTITVARRIKQDKTQNFQNARAKRIYGRGHVQQETFRDRKANKTVYETITVPLPIYIEITYTLSFYAEYQQQINEMISPFVTKTGGVNHFILKKDGHLYEGFIQSDFSQNNNVASLSEEERKYQTNLDIKVLGYLIGADKNDEQPKIVRRESRVEVKIPRERVIKGDISEYLKDDKGGTGFYRE